MRLRPLKLTLAVLSLCLLQAAVGSLDTGVNGKCAPRASPSAAPAASPPAASGTGPVQAPAGAASPGVHTESLTPVQQEQGDYYDYDLPAKQSWPELVGTNAQQAQGIIAKSPGIKSVQLVQVGQAVTDDYVTTRVRVYYAPSTDKVAQTPKIG